MPIFSESALGSTCRNLIRGNSLPQHRARPTYFQYPTLTTQSSLLCQSLQEVDPVGAGPSTVYQEKLLESHRLLERLRENRLAQLQPKEVQPDMVKSLPTTRLISTAKTIDRRVYDQVAASRNRLSQQLSEKNRYIRHLESAIEERTAAVEAAHSTVVRIASELESLKRLSEVAVAAATYGVGKADAVARSTRILRRAELLHLGMQQEAKVLDSLVMREIPVTWYGVATEVVMVGDWDNWTEGFSLSPEVIHDQTFTKFHSVVKLLPGSYQVKFRVDGQWRLAPDWPVVEVADGSTNNILVVE